MSELDDVKKQARELASSPTFPGWDAIGQQFGREMALKGKEWDFCPYCIASRAVTKKLPDRVWMVCGHTIPIQPEIDE